MDIEEAGYELGMPTYREMLDHQAVLLAHEAEQAWSQLARVQLNVRKLVAINIGLNDQIRALQQQLVLLRAQQRLDAFGKPHAFSTWGGETPKGKKKPLGPYPIL